MHSLWQDIRYGLRGLRNQPGFTFLTVLTLSLGIGAATTIFSVLYNVLVDPTIYVDAERIVSIQIRDVTDPGPYGRIYFQTPEFLDYQEQSTVYEDVLAGTFEDILHATDEGTEQFRGSIATENLFRFLGVQALAGRTFAPDDAKPGAPPVFVMSHRMWRERYQQDPTVLNRVFVLNGTPTTCVGIMPERFTKQGADLYRPVVLDRADPAMSRRYFRFQGRLKPGVTMEQARAEAEVIARRLAEVYPDNYPEQFNVEIVSWLDSIVGPFRGNLYALAGAVGLLLLIACGNVANMLLARASTREKEMAIRSAIGARQSRLVRQLLVESLLLALAGAAFGCLLAWGGLKVLVPLIPQGVIPSEVLIRLNTQALLFSLAAAMFTALLFGLAPALQTARHDLINPLKDAGRGVSGGFRRGKLRNTLVVVQVALSLVLMAGAGLMMRTFIALQNTDLGLNPDNVMITRLPLPKGQYTTAAARHQFFQTLLRRLHALPGVVSATAASSLPPYGGFQSEIDIPGKAHTERWEAIFQLCSTGYFPTLQLRLLRGRLLSEIDVGDGRLVAVVNQTLVDQYFGQQDPLGRQIKINRLETLPEYPVENPVFEIIGVIADAKNQGVEDPPQPEMFVPFTVTGAFERSVMVRTVGEPMALLNNLRSEIWSVDRGIALTFTGTLNEYLARFSYSQPRFSLILFGVFAGIGLVLVVLGVYSVIAYTVSRQTQEIGLRMALGAGDADVLRMVLRMGLRLIAAGIIIGTLAALAASRVIASQLWGVSQYDPVTLTAVVVLVILAGLTACYVPARRATRVDPLVALRYD